MPNRAFKFETMSADDFEDLILDMPADERWELIGGRVVRGMVGARWEHHRIVQNISRCDDAAIFACQELSVPALSTRHSGSRKSFSICRSFPM